jgi:hypothetical protein
MGLLQSGFHVLHKYIVAKLIMENLTAEVIIFPCISFLCTTLRINISYYNEMYILFCMWAILRKIIRLGMRFLSWIKLISAASFCSACICSICFKWPMYDWMVGVCSSYQYIDTILLLCVMPIYPQSIFVSPATVIPHPFLDSSIEHSRTTWNAFIRFPPLFSSPCHKGR